MIRNVVSPPRARLVCLPVLVVGMLLVVASAPPAAEPKVPEEKGKANRLVKESSPYLLQHAYNPVDWHPWGTEAFEKAKKENKLVFLSIGYSSCHWCHVMEKESFSNPEVAAILNQNFICIKVDREERPDIDEIYMTALHTMNERGGWPLSMFLTSDAKPIIGGTYWPREDREFEGKTLAGFKTVLKKIHEIWKEKPKDIEAQADHFAEATNTTLTQAVRANPIVTLERSLAQGAAQVLSEEIDPIHGGLGRKASQFKGTKFPMPATMLVLLDHAVRDKDDALLKLVRLTLDKMAMGGIYDQIGGGFHRYSTERTWTVPHFEKMLYDNAQLVELYAEAYRHTKDPNYARVVRETLGFIKRELTSPEGGFFAALDADSDGEEGTFYVWTPEEIEKVLGDATDVALVRAVYGIGGTPNFENKFFIPRLKQTLDDVAKEQKLSRDELDKKLAAIKSKLLEYRSKRVRPFLDTKILTAWNGQMIAGYAKAGEMLKEPEYVKTAARAADFVLKNLHSKEGRLLRTYGKTADGKWEAKLNGYLDDYTFLINGLLNLHDASGEQRWLDEAKTLTDQMIKWYGDGDKGGYFFTSSDHEKLFARPKDYTDNVLPSANGMALRNFVRLWRKTKDDRYQKLAEKSFRQFAGVLRTYPSGVPTMCLALHDYLDAKDTKADVQAPKKDVPLVTGQETTADVVKIAVSKAESPSGATVLTVSLTIAEPWHIYANPTGNEMLAQAATEVTIRANGRIIPAEIAYPEGEKEINRTVGDHQIYEKSVSIKATLPDKVEGPFEVSVKLQACTKGDKGICLARTTLKSIVK